MRLLLLLLPTLALSLPLPTLFTPTTTTIPAGETLSYTPGQAVKFLPDTTASALTAADLMYVPGSPDNGVDEQLARRAVFEAITVPPPGGDGGDYVPGR